MSTVIPIVSVSPKKKNKTKKHKHGKDSITKTIKAVKKKNGSNCSLHASEVKDLEPISKRFDIFKDQHLVKKFLSVPMSNNQKENASWAATSSSHQPTLQTSTAGHRPSPMISTRNGPVLLLSSDVSQSTTTATYGRIRQVMKESLHGTSDALLPDIINVKIQALVANNYNISDTDLRKVRILYNMLRSAIARNEAKKQLDDIMDKMNEEEVKPKLKRKLDAKKDKKNKKTDNVVTEAGDTDRHVNEIKVIKHVDNKSKQVDDKLYRLKPGIEKIKQLDSKINKIKHDDSKTSKTKQDDSKTSKTKQDDSKTSKLQEENKMIQADVPEEKPSPKVQKKKKVKRYVVFVGNLPRDVTKEQLVGHFREIAPLIKHIRIPKPRNEAKRPYAYVELENEPSYEMALCKHHTMLGTRRINVLYTTQQKTTMSKGEAKSKSAKLQALIKSGKLVGSVPIEKKRSFRRKKKKLAEKKQGL